jgi:hypothetical protein
VTVVDQVKAVPKLILFGKIPDLAVTSVNGMSKEHGFKGVALASRRWTSALKKWPSPPPPPPPPGGRLQNHGKERPYC